MYFLKRTQSNKLIEKVKMANRFMSRNKCCLTWWSTNHDQLSYFLFLFCFVVFFFSLECAPLSLCLCSAISFHSHSETAWNEKKNMEKKIVDDNVRCVEDVCYCLFMCSFFFCLLLNFSSRTRSYSSYPFNMNSLTEANAYNNVVVFNNMSET